jgi:hypothetical protein
MPMPSPAPMTMPEAIDAGSPRSISGSSRNQTPAGAATPSSAGGIRNNPGSSMPISLDTQMPVPTP